MRKLLTSPSHAWVPLLVVLAAGCARQDEPADDVATDTTAFMESAEQTQDMLAPVRAAGLLIVEHGQLAAQRATRQDVREFSQTAATDHRAIISVLDSVGGRRGATLHETQGARELAHTVRMAHAGLENMPAETFDLAFIRAQVESHRQLLNTIDQDVLPVASSPEMQTLIQDVRGTVDAHLTRARQLLGSLLGEPVEPPPTGAAPQQAPAPQPPQQTPPPPPRTVPDTIPPSVQEISHR